MSINGGPEGLKKQRDIDRLTGELQRLQQKLRDPERQATEGCFGSATSAAKRRLKAKTPSAKDAARKGARPGPPGTGRQAFDVSQAARVVDVDAGLDDRCPGCDTPSVAKGIDSRAALESHPVQAERVLYRLPKSDCPRGRRIFPPRAPAVLPKRL
jgi:hypothetical protein